MVSGYEAERRQILEMLESGSISGEEAIALLNALGGRGPEEGSEPEVEEQSEPAPEANEKVPEQPPGPEVARRRIPRGWLVALWTGLGLLAGGLWMLFQALQQPSPGFWFYCSLVPITLGAISLALAWSARRARWLQIRIDRDEESAVERRAWSLPLPWGLTAWVIGRMPLRGSEETRSALRGVLAAFEEHATAEQPITVEVSGRGPDEHFEFFLG